MDGREPGFARIVTDRDADKDSTPGSRLRRQTRTDDARHSHTDADKVKANNRIKSDCRGWGRMNDVGLQILRGSFFFLFHSACVQEKGSMKSGPIFLLFH